MSLRADKVERLKAELAFATQELGDTVARQVSKECPPFPNLLRPLVMKFRAVVAADEAETVRIFPAPPPPAEGPNWLKYLAGWDGETPMVTAE